MTQTRVYRQLDFRGIVRSLSKAASLLFILRCQLVSAALKAIVKRKNEAMLE